METQQRDMRAAAANARAARTLSKQRRWAQEMRACGWYCAETSLEDGIKVVKAAMQLAASSGISTDQAVRALLLATRAVDA